MSNAPPLWGIKTTQITSPPYEWREEYPYGSRPLSVRWNSDMLTLDLSVLINEGTKNKQTFRFVVLTEDTLWHYDLARYSYLGTFRMTRSVINRYVFYVFDTSS